MSIWFSLLSSQLERRCRKAGQHYQIIPALSLEVCIHELPQLFQPPVYTSNTQRLASESLCDSTQVTHSLSRSGTQAEVSRPTVQGHSQQHCQRARKLPAPQLSQLCLSLSMQQLQNKSWVIKIVATPPSSKRGRMRMQMVPPLQLAPNLALSTWSGEGGRWLDSPSSAHCTQS